MHLIGRYLRIVLLTGTFLFAFSSATDAATLVFQHGASGYAGTVDTFLKQSAGGSSQGGLLVVEWDGSDGSPAGPNIGLVRFDNIFGVLAGQIQPGDTITSATFTYVVNNPGNSANVSEVLVDWNESVTYNTFGGDPGVQGDEISTQFTTADGASGTRTIDVTGSLVAWKANPSLNKGWIFQPSGDDGVEFRSREHGTVSERPKLTVVVNEGSPQSKVLIVKHQPYLQLGDAPLANTGPGVGLTDQIVIVWQTVESGTVGSPSDFFTGEYRLAGSSDPWTSAGAVSQLVTGTGTRVNHWVTVTGLPYATMYEYRVIHKRNPGNPVTVDTYNGTFTTRRAPSDPTTFKFAAYGDSVQVTSSSTVARFESVMARVTALDAAFVQLLGDNIYDTGTHDAYDGRFDGSIVPNQSAYIRNHIEYFCDGNHDSGDPQRGLPSRQNYFVPIPVAGVTSPASVPPAAGENPEDNYSYDYGLVHFTIIDSTAWGGLTPSDPSFVSQTRQTAIMNYLTADLQASNHPWKSVVAHHPPKSAYDHSDTGEGMAAELIPILVQNGADLLLCGHSHNYQRSFPLTGYSGGVTFDAVAGSTYVKGAQVIEILAGTGGRSIDSNINSPNSARDWLATAFVSDNGGEVGPMLFEVSEAELRVKYISAATGAIKEEFVIVQPGPSIALSTPTILRAAHIGDPVPNGGCTVAKGGPDTLPSSIVDNAPWLRVSPAGGSSTGEADPITVSYDPAGLLAGDHVAQITVSSPDALNSPQLITVTLTIETVSPDFDGDGDVDLTDFGFLQTCFTPPGVAPLDPACDVARLDPDLDVDANDFGIFQACLSGANIPADPTCDD